MVEVNLTPNDLIIAVMGVTGVGKSTFIQQFTEEKVAVGRTLESCTSNVEIYKCSTNNIPQFYLIDTPGFDDSTRSDSDILREVASWLSMAYSNDIKLTGIIYLHRILDVRLGGAAMRNLRMFKKLCGEDSLEGVVLATTFWSQVDLQTAQMRENQLETKKEFWGGMIERGSKMFRHDDGVVSGEAIINHLVERRVKLILEIQRELVDNHKTLDETEAGVELQAELAKAKAEYEKKLTELRQDMKDALKARDKAWEEEVQRGREELEAKMRKDEEDRAKLQATQEQLWQQREAEREEERREWLEEKLENERRIGRYERELEIAKVNNLHSIQLEQVMSKLRLEEQKARIYQEQEEQRRNELKNKSKCVVM